MRKLVYVCLFFVVSAHGAMWVETLGSLNPEPLTLVVNQSTVAWFSYSGSLATRGPDINLGGTTGTSTNQITSKTGGDGNIIAGGIQNLIQGSSESGIFAGLQCTIQTNGTRAAIISSSSSLIHSNASNSVIVGGDSNDLAINGAINVLNAVILGGITQTNQGNYSTILGGSKNFVSSQVSIAGGTRAKVTHDGVFAFSDSTAADFADIGQDTFNVRIKSFFLTNDDGAGHWMSFSNGVITGNGSCITNTALTVITNATAPADTSTIRAWLNVTNDQGKVGKIPVYY